jgi:hypothetical protein
MADLVTVKLVLSHDGRGPLCLRVESGAVYEPKDAFRPVSEWVGPHRHTGHVSTFGSSQRITKIWVPRDDEGIERGAA